MNALQKAGLLQLLPRMSVINSTECMNLFQQEYGVNIDHHEFAYYLDRLHTEGFLEIVKPGGRVGYSLKIQQQL